MASPTFEQSPAEVAADLRAARHRLDAVTRERDDLQRQVAALRPALEASERAVLRLVAERDEANRRAELAVASTRAHQMLMCASFPESIRLDELVVALSRWKPGRVLALELGPWVRSLSFKDLPPGPDRKHVVAAVELSQRQNRIPLLVLLHEGTKTQPVVVSFTPGTPEEIRAQLQEILPGTYHALVTGRPLLEKRNKVAFSVLAEVTEVEGEVVRCAAQGMQLSLSRPCFPHEEVVPGLSFTVTVIVEPQRAPQAASAGTRA